MISRYGGITGNVTLQYRPVLTDKEDGAVAEGGDVAQVAPCLVVCLVGIGARLILGGVGFVNFIVEPHVVNCHSILSQSSSFIRTNSLPSSLF